MRIDQDDRTVFDNVKKGDLQAYHTLFLRYFSDLCNFLLLYLHSNEICEEIALDIFAWLWEKRDSVEIKSSVRNFLFSAAKNKAITSYRKEQRYLFSGLSASELLIPESDHTEHILENKELQFIIQKAINELPERSRQVYQMAWEENLSYKEIAAQLNLSPKTVENHISIALRKLRESLKPYYKQIFSLLLLISPID